MIIYGNSIKENFHSSHFFSGHYYCFVSRLSLKIGQNKMLTNDPPSNVLGAQLLERTYWLLKCDGFWLLWFGGLLLSKNDWENYGICLESDPQWGKELFQGWVWLDTGERKLCQACNLWIQIFHCILQSILKGIKPLELYSHNYTGPWHRTETRWKEQDMSANTKCHHCTSWKDVPVHSKSYWDAQRESPQTWSLQIGQE